MSNHAPGPWWIDWNVSRLDIFSSDAATLVATLRRSALSEGMEETARANARLIAAAPELLAALKRATDLLARYDHDDAWLQGRAAIAKATEAA